ncbi:MAG: ComEC/Rec2 family competence protein [Chloroflexota bacterium]|nr:ComEC/Rec2 family competence protein [Chloroflexota bacterium]MDE3193570.1 ComEC/Rec2 family competence protein [Chloroflexota bacterium]
MTRLLRAPLVAAAAVATLCAVASLCGPITQLALGSAFAVVALPLALVSDDRPRRVLWSAVAVVGVASALRTLVALPALEPSADAHVVGLRASLAAPLRALIPEPEGSIVLGIVLGERSAIPRDLRAAFAVTGTTHILAISGFNMTLVAAGAAMALRGRAPSLAVAIATVAAVSAYSVLVGPQPSVVRAALMSAVGSLGLALGRPGVAANALGAAVALMLLVDPAALEDVGFLLSVSATAGLIVWERAVRARLAHLPAWAAEGLAATIAASTPTIPIVAAVFGRISLVSPIANLFAVPLFAPIMVFGAAAAAVGAVAPAAAWPLAMAAYASASLFRRGIEVAAAVPLAAVTVPPGVGTGALVAIALLVGALALRAPTRVGRLGAVVAALRGPRFAMPRPLSLSALRGRGVATSAAGLLCLGALAGSAFGASNLTASATFRIHALDVGQGDAFLIESEGRYALVDGGPDPAVLLRQLGAALPPWQRRIDLIALSHEHADHGAGLIAVLEHYAVGTAIEPVGMNDVPFVRQWSDALARAGVPRRAVGAGASVRLGAVTVRVLAPEPDRRVDVPSLAMRVESPRSSLLLLGDSVDDALADLLLRPDALASRVLVPQHHGAESVRTRELVAAVRPELVILSVGAGNRYGHPAPPTLAALEGLPVYRTDRYGTVDVDLDGQPLVAHTAKAGVPPDRGGPVPHASSSR